MVVMTTWFVAACLGVAPAEEPSKLARDAVVETFTPPAPPKIVPKIAFELREITVASPDWRGKMLARLEPIARQEGTAVWAIDHAGLVELLAYCQGDARCSVAQSPKMIAKVGEPARGTSENN